MPNYFDQFDATEAAGPKISSGNYFDQFHVGDTAIDVAKGGGAGLGEGAISLLGGVGNIQHLARSGAGWLAEKLGVPPERVAAAQRIAGQGGAMTSGQITKVVEDQTGPFYKAQTVPGQFAQTIGQHLAGAAIPSGGGLLRSLGLFRVLPGVASETAGQFTDQNPLAKAGASLVAGGLGAALSRPSTAAGVIGDAAPNLTPQIVNEAERLIADAAGRGIRLRWDEAIQQVTNSGTMLGDVGRVAEASQRGGAVIRGFHGDRPQAIERAAQNEFGNIAPPNLNPSTIGPAAAEAAGRTVEDVRGAINQRTRPLYQAAEAQRLPAAEYQALANDPRYVAALESIRNHPELGPQYQHLPNDAIGVVDATKKLLRTRSEVTPQADATERYLGSLRGTAAENASNAATRSSRDYAGAVSEQAQLRGQYLNPLEQGTTGQLARSQGTQGAVNAVFPKSPLAGSEHEVATAVRATARNDLGAARDLVRQHAEQTFNNASRDLIAGGNQMGGAKFRAAIVGNAQQERNLAAAVNELPNGQRTWEGFSRFLDILEATGRRQHIGSKTEFNRLLTRELEGGSLVGAPATIAASPATWVRYIRDRYQEYRYGHNTEELARILTDPASAPLFHEIARHGPNSAQGMIAAGKVLFNASGPMIRGK